jgi:co-chaperonin GroES (HSP10)
MRQGIILGNQIVVREIQEKEITTQAGLVLPKQVVKKPNTQGKVMLVGEGKDDDLIQLKVGMTVLYPPLAAQKFVLDDDNGEPQELHLVPKARILFAFSE